MMNRSTLLRTISLLSTVTTLSACTLLATKNEAQEIVRKADQFKDEKPPSANRDLVSFTAPQYFGSRVIRSSHGEPLPTQIASLRLTLRRSSPMSLAQFAEALSQAANHLPIRVEGRIGSQFSSTTNGPSFPTAT